MQNNEQINEYKIFVGNVPYCCNQHDFENVFKEFDGYIHAEIVNANMQNRTNMSRGFGFVTFKTKEQADNLKTQTNIILKNRTLRFTEYQTDIVDRYKTFDKYRYNEQPNYLLIENIPHDKDKNWLKNIFSNYKPIGKHFIMMNQKTGEIKNTGIVEILDDSKFKDLLTKRYIDVDNVLLELSRYKRIDKSCRLFKHQNN